MKLVFLVCCVLTVSLSSATAETLYFEDFSSGNSSLDVWTQTWGTGSVDASSGDLVITGNWAMAITGVPEVENLAHTSIRTQIAFEGDTSSGISLATNVDVNALTAYQGGYNPGVPRLFIGWNSPRYQGFVTRDEDFNLKGGDELILQFDVFDDTLELWAWRPGEPMPIEPQLSYVDESVKLAPGVPGLLFDANGSTSSATYRFIRVDNVSIPEPSSSVLGLITFVCVGLFWLHRLRAQ